MSDTKTIKEIMATMNARRFGGDMKYVRDWKSQIPAASRWHPGDPGDPNCEICEGTGWLRMDLPIGHPDFGKLFLCDCVSQDIVAKAKKEDEERNAKAGRR